MIPHKRVEGAQLHPSYAQLLSGVASEAADVSAGERHPAQAELQHGWEGGQKGPSKSESSYGGGTLTENDAKS